MLTYIIKLLNQIVSNLAPVSWVIFSPSVLTKEDITSQNLKLTMLDNCNNRLKLAIHMFVICVSRSVCVCMSVSMSVKDKQAFIGHSYSYFIQYEWKILYKIFDRENRIIVFSSNSYFIQY